MKPDPSITTPERRRQSRLKTVLAVAVVAVVTLAISEVLVRVLLSPPGIYENPKEDPLYVTDPTRGYILKPGAHSDYVTPEIDIDIDISSDGLRDTTLAVARQAGLRVLAVGNSFTLGLGVAREDTWAEQLEDLLTARDSAPAAVVNGGVPGYSPHQIRLTLEKLLAAVQPDLVIFGFATETYDRMTDPNQLLGGTLIRSSVVPRTRVTSDGLVYSPLVRPWMRATDLWLNRQFELGAHFVNLAYRAYGGLRHSRETSAAEAWSVPAEDEVEAQMAPSFEELRIARQFSAAHDVPFVVLLINVEDPEGFAPRQSVYNQVTMRFCERVEMTCVDPLPELLRQADGRPIFRTLSDQHWTPAAHSIAAGMLVPFVPERR